MPLNSATLSTLIQTKLVGQQWITPGPEWTAFCDAIAQAVVEHIQSSAALVVVTTCPAGPGTGTGTVT